MKKKLIVFILMTLLGFILFFAYKYYAERPGNPTEKRLETQDLIHSLPKFVSLIRFQNGRGITMEKSEGFSYTFEGGDGIYQFIPSEFYAKNEGKESILRNKISFFLDTRELDGIRLGKEDELPEMLQVHNQIHNQDVDGKNNLESTKNKLETRLKQARISTDEMTQLSYIYNLEGDYEKGHALDERNCRKNKERCKSDVKILVEGSVKDQDGAPVSKAAIYTLNYPNRLPVKTDANGIFKIELNTKSLEKIRVRAMKDGYAAAYGDFYVVTGAPNQKRKLDLVINQSHGTVVIDTKNKKISIGDKGSQVEVAKFDNGVFTIQTNFSTYEIPYNAIVKKDGRSFRGEVNVYIYEFDKSSNIENLLRVDARSNSDDTMFFGGSLVTFGMPYLQFFATDTSEELYIEKSNPAAIRMQIAEMDSLINGGSEESGVNRATTTKEMEKIVADSKRLGGYPISRKYLLDNNMAHFPLWWMLDQKRGIWETVPIRMLTIDGLGESIFYSIRLDNRRSPQR